MQKTFSNYIQTLKLTVLILHHSQNEKQSAIRDCTKAIQLDPNYVKAYLRRANLYEETEKFDEALEDFKKVLTFDPSHSESNCAIRVSFSLKLIITY